MVEKPWKRVRREYQERMRAEYMIVGLEALHWSVLWSLRHGGPWRRDRDIDAPEYATFEAVRDASDADLLRLRNFGRTKLKLVRAITHPDRHHPYPHLFRRGLSAWERACGAQDG